MESDQQLQPGSIDHDHTRLDILFEDLVAIVRVASVSPMNAELLEDARQQWLVLQEEIFEHFSREESRMFRQVYQTNKDDAIHATIQVLVNQHKVLRTLLVDLGGRLIAESRGSSGSDSILRDSWLEFEKLWHSHSTIEWDLLQKMPDHIRDSYFIE